jgi:ubiquinone/menaquinone biosynthesis C-methylase UbiE
MRRTRVTCGRRPAITNLSTTHVLRLLWWAWHRNWLLGPAERARGLHYWLGYDYALILTLINARAGQRWVDVGAGAHSIFPYLLAARHDVTVLGVDITGRLPEQVTRAQRAVSTGLISPGQVHWVRGDARRLPLADASADGVTAISTLEHLTEGHDDRAALAEIHRVLRPGGEALVTVPFEAAGSKIEQRAGEPFQRVYSADTMRTSFIEPSGLSLERWMPYGERLPFYAASRRLPRWADRLRRPVDTVATAVLMTPYLRRLDRASAALLQLRRPREAQR